MKRFLLLPLAALAIAAAGPRDGCRGVSASTVVTGAQYRTAQGSPYTIVGVFNLHPEMYGIQFKPDVSACKGYVEVRWLRTGESSFMNLIAYQDGDAVQLHMWSGQ